MDIEQLKRKRAQIIKNSDIILNNMKTVEGETRRVAEIAHNSQEHLDNLDREFEEVTGLDGKDVLFLFIATGLQIARIVIINELTKVESAGVKNRNETKLHDLQSKLLKRINSGESVYDKPYYASLEHIITKKGVPYDATAPLTKERICRLFGKDQSWGIDLDTFMPEEKISLFKGANHRFSTLGHDPILGLLFGTANIMTNTITCIQTPLIAKDINIPILTTNHVIYTSDFKEPQIATYASTGVMFGRVAKRTIDEPAAFVAALIKQILHIGTDLYTTCGIQIPGANLILSNTNVEKLTKIISSGDIIKFFASAKLSEFINMIIAAVHILMYDPMRGYSQDIYSVKTKKIIMYSNTIAAASNVIWTGVNLYAGNEGAIRQMDWGGLLITLKRLVSDTEYIRKIKNEFVFEEFNKLIMGVELQLEDISWDF